MKSDAELLEVCYAGIEPFVRIHAGARGGSVLQQGPLTGSLLPSSPKSSLLNAFVYDQQRGNEVAGQLAAIDVAVADEGIIAWGVWVVDGDEVVESALKNYGFVLDSQPQAMGVELAALQLDAQRADGVVERWDPRLMAEINERAYGVKPGRFSDPLAEMRQPEGAQMFFARDADGDPAAVAMSLHLPGGDCSLYWVATEPDRHRQGLGSAVMTAALIHAVDNGCTTTTLQASNHGGGPLYLSLGYRDLGKSVNLWELRR